MKIIPTFDCECGRTHTCPIQEVVVGTGAIREVPRLLKAGTGELSDIREVLIVSDGNTRPLCFKELADLLAAADIQYHEVVYEGTDVLIPDETAIARLEAGVEAYQPQAIIGIGSGVINDLCKYGSFLHHIPYMIIATAPSMDGFASVGAALILKGMKVTITAHTATWIVGDTRILREAPLDMIRAGIGDILGKYSCLNDWKLASLITGEHFCQRIYDMTLQEVLVTRTNIRGCLQREEEAIGALMNSLVQVGVAMAYMGNSRPASGSEHHFSHFFEIMGVLQDKPYLPHGIDVAYSTILTCELREKLSGADPSRFVYAYDSEVQGQRIRDVFGPLAGEVLALQERTGLYERNDLPVIQDQWDAICGILKEAPGRQEMQELLTAAGYDEGRFAAFYGKERIRTAVEFAKDLKDRYTILWLLQNAGLLEAYAEGLVETLFDMGER